MTADLSAPPFVLDVRVATSPMVGLRYGVDGRATDIEDLISRIEAAVAETSAERDDVRERLRPYDGNHRAMVERVTGKGHPAYLQRLEEGLALRVELTRLDERIQCMRERISALRDQRAALRRLKKTLVGIDNLDHASIDSPGAAANQAVRQLFHLIDVDHDVTAQHIFEGPMQLLADAALQTELVGRAVGDDREAAVAGVSRARHSTDAALQALEHVVFAIHPAELRTEGLVACLRRLVDGVGDRAAVRLRVLGSPRQLSHGVEVALFRIVQEAVANAAGHGHATRVDVTLLFQRTRVRLVVRDDGEGFDVAATEARLGRSTGLGMISMRERAELEGGRLEVRSLVGEGTEVRASFEEAAPVA